jgi:aspartate-semialdehyde dehydrogenase
MKNVVVLGATGLVGEEVLRILEQRDFPVKELFLFASERSEGRTMSFKDNDVAVLAEYEDIISEAEIVFGCLDAPFAKEIIPKFRDHAVVIDNSSAYRMDTDVPLVIPEINPEKAKDHSGIIANPNCSTIQMLVPLYPLHKKATVKHIIVATYQSVSGYGRAAVDQLEYEIECLGMHSVPETSEDSVFSFSIGNNIIPHIGSFNEDGYTKEELKMVNETRKIFSVESINVTATCVRIPVYVGHSEAVSVEFEQPLSPRDARDILKDAPGVELIDDEESYPMPVHVVGTDQVFVGRIREDKVFKNGLAMWIVADNVRKGAALNAVQIAELLL